MILQMNPASLQQRLADHALPAPLLIDVREDWEYRLCHIAGSVSIPLARIPERIAALDPVQETVLICHHGVRSQRAALYLEQRGFVRLGNLEGGIDGAAMVDPAMPRY